MDSIQQQGDNRVVDPEDVLDEDADEDTLFMTNGNGEVIRPSSRSSVKRVSNAISKMSAEKKKIINDISFGGLLKLPQLNKVDRGFTFWLLNQVDCSDKKIVVNGRDAITMEPTDVERIVGIPRGPKSVCGLGTDDPEKKFHFIQYNIGAEEDESNSLLAVRMNVEEEYEEEMTDREVACFKVSFVVYALGYFLAPTTKANHGSNAFWGALLDPQAIPTYNWCQYVLDMLIESARKAQIDMQTKKKCANVTGCPLLLQMMFLDKINLGALNRPSVIRPRVSGLTCELMRRMVVAAGMVNGDVKPVHLNEQRNIARQSCSDGAIGKHLHYTGCANSLCTQQKKGDGSNSLQNKVAVQFNVSRYQAMFPPVSGQGVRGYLPPNPLGEFINSIEKGKLSTSQLTALKLFNARVLLHTNQMKMQIQRDTVNLVKKLCTEVVPDKSISNHSAAMSVSKKRLAEECTSDGDACSEATSSAWPYHVTESVATKRQETTDIRNDKSKSLMLSCGTKSHPITELLLATPTSGKACEASKGGNDAGEGTEQSLGHPDLTFHCRSSFKTPKHSMTTLTLGTPTSKILDDSSFKTPAQPLRKLTTTPSPMPGSVLFVDNMSTPSNNVTTAHVLLPSSPKTVTKLFNEATLFGRLLMAEEEGLNLNATDPHCDFTTSPVVKRHLTEGRIAKSPWVIGIHHPQPEEEVTERLSRWLVCADSNELTRTWVMHDTPRHIELTGKTIADIFCRDSEMSYDAIDICIRRLGQLDGQMSLTGKTPRWRHMLESDFPVVCLAGEDPVHSKTVREQFIGDSVDYEINKCRMIVIPVRATKTWCCYFWDFRCNVVHVFDPMNDGTSLFEENHATTIQTIQDGLSRCIENLYTGWKPSFLGWRRNFVVIPKYFNQSNKTGILTVLAIRDFDGARLTTNGSEGWKCAIDRFRTILLYEVLATSGNCAKLPLAFVERTN